MIAAESCARRLEVERSRLSRTVVGRLRLGASGAGEFDHPIEVAVAERDPCEPSQTIALATKVRCRAPDTQALLGPLPRANLLADAEGKEMVGVENARAVDGWLFCTRRAKCRGRNCRAALHVTGVEPGLAPDARYARQRPRPVARLHECTNLGSNIGPGHRARSMPVRVCVNQRPALWSPLWSPL